MKWNESKTIIIIKWKNGKENEQKVCRINKLENVYGLDVGSSAGVRFFFFSFFFTSFFNKS